MRTDFESLENGQRITLHPNSNNPLHKEPIGAFFSDGYFYCDGNDGTDGPDYYFGDVARFNEGFTVPATPE